MALSTARDAWGREAARRRAGYEVVEVLTARGPWAMEALTPTLLLYRRCSSLVLCLVSSSLRTGTWGWWMLCKPQSGGRRWAQRPRTHSKAPGRQEV